YKRATNECEFPPLGIGVQAIQLSPYRSGVAGPPHTRLLWSPAFRPCACPLALSGPGQAVASESSALNSGLLWRQFTPCVTWRTLSLHPAPQWCGSCHEDHRTDGSRDCLSALHTYLGTGPGSCHMQVYSPPSLPHHRSHVSLSWTLLQAFASWEILPRPSHAADNLLHSSGEPWRGYTVPGSCIALRVGLHYTPGYLRDAIWITG